MGHLRVRNLGKAYKRYPQKWGRLAEWVGFGIRHDLNWVLRDVSFDVSPGEAVGIVGSNGAGKSTLLKLITGTIRPTTGAFEAGGRIAALLELGIGFHPEFTGRQNVFMAGHILGIPAHQITSLMGAIEAFAEIGEYVDEPVRTYSSGMQVRLAFSVATAVRPDILIVDEALSVGDTYFQHKSFDRIRQFRDQGTTLLFVSHSPSAIKTLCNRAILLEHGVLLRDGSPDAVLDYYNALIAAQRSDYEIRQTEIASGRMITRSGTAEATIESVELLECGTPIRAVRSGATVSVKIVVKARKNLPELTVGILIRDRLGNDVFGTNTFHLGSSLAEAVAGESRSIEFAFAELNLGVGSYSLTVAAHAGDTHVASNYDWWDRTLVFQVVPGSGPASIGVCSLPVSAEWRKVEENCSRRAPRGDSLCRDQRAGRLPIDCRPRCLERTCCRTRQAKTMNDIPEVEIRVEALMDEIRDEVARRKVHGPQTKLSWQARLVDDMALHDRYTLSEFLSFDGEDFIWNAYLGLLRREPDRDGLVTFLADLQTRRRTKLEILKILLHSAEGRAVGARIRGLADTSLFEARSVVLPRLDEPSGAIEQKKLYALRDFIEFQDDDFVRNAYLGILCRQPERNGYDYFLGALRSGRLNKIEILGRLRYSREGRVAAVTIKGLALRFGLSVFRKVPILGRILGILQYVVRLPDWVRKQERLETALYFQSGVAEQIEGHLSDLNSRIASAAEKLAAELGDLSGYVATARRMGALTERIGRLTAISESLSSRQDTLAPRSRVEELEREMRSEYERLIALLEQKVSQERLSEVTAELQEVRSSLDVERSQTLDYRSDFHDQQRRLTSLLEETREQLRKLTREPTAAVVSEADHTLDAFYSSFEDRFRGTPAEIKERVQVYVPIVRAAGAGTRTAPILDIGCGRGEWLELLRENNLTARGVDLNRVMIDRCRQRELDVVKDDAIEYLRGQRKDSLGAVTGMHIIEHIPFTKLLALLDETLRVLKPGGVAIFETPNPENLVTGACNFYFDPTHIRPLPPESTKFVVEERGFSRVEILRLHPYPVEAMLTDGTIQVRERINNMLYGPQDYAILAFKA